MATGMWTAVSGATAQAQNLEMIANNLANADTPAFKKDIPTFKEYLATTERIHDSVDIPRGPIKDKDLYPQDGRDQSHVINDSSNINQSQGRLRVTHSQFDLALDGPGFFEVSTPTGIRFTRLGSFKTSDQGRLVTAEGHPVLLQSPPGLAANLPVNTPQGALPAAARVINLKDRGVHFTISEQGEVYAGDELIGALSIVEFKDVRKLRKSGGQLFEDKDMTGNNKVDVAQSQTKVRQGMIETSNVNPIEEMTQMIKANRLFEADLKALKTYGELMGREANDIGKL